MNGLYRFFHPQATFGQRSDYVLLPFLGNYISKASESSLYEKHKVIDILIPTDVEYALI